LERLAAVAFEKKKQIAAELLVGNYNFMTLAQSFYLKVGNWSQGYSACEWRTEFRLVN